MANITKKADGKYLIRVSKGSGKGRRYINKTFRGTLKQAREHAREIETLQDSGFAHGSIFTFGEYFEMWIKAIKPSIAPRTLDGYEGSIRRYALEQLREVRLSDIRSHHIQRIYLALTHLSPTTVRNLHAGLRTCFAYAAKRDYIRLNPCRRGHVDLPAKSQKEIVVMDDAEAWKFVDLCQRMPNGLVFDFALETGMRPEEYLALRWADITGNDVSVRQAVQFNRSGGGYYFKEVKTAAGRRRIPISEHLRKRLFGHRHEQNIHRLAMKGTWFDHGLVFANEIGRPFPINNLTRRYLTPILAECGFDKHITLYALRHTMATLLLLAGVNVKIVSERLGHASIAITLDTYSHILPGMQETATNAMDNVLRMVKR